MAIQVRCKQCGKELRAKDDLAGKVVKCPGCQAPLKIVAAGSPAAPSAPAPKSPAPAPARTTAPSAAPRGAVDVNAAIAKVEAARQKRESATAEKGAQKSGVEQLVAEFDKVQPKAAEKQAAADQKKKEASRTDLIPKPTKVTTATKAADFMGMVKASSWFKYVVIVVLLTGGGLGSQFVIKKVMTATTEESQGKPVTDEMAKEKITQAELAFEKQQYDDVRRLLQEIPLGNPHRKKWIKYDQLRIKFEKATGTKVGG